MRSKRVMLIAAAALWGMLLMGKAAWAGAPASSVAPPRLMQPEAVPVPARTDRDRALQAAPATEYPWAQPPMGSQSPDRSPGWPDRQPAWFMPDRHRDVTQTGERGRPLPHRKRSPTEPRCRAGTIRARRHAWLGAAGAQCAVHLTITSRSPP